MSLTHRIIHLEVEQVEGAALAFEQVLGLPDDGRDQPLEAHLLLEEAPGQRQKQLKSGSQLPMSFYNKVSLSPHFVLQLMSCE